MGIGDWGLGIGDWGLGKNRLKQLKWMIIKVIVK